MDPELKDIIYEARIESPGGWLLQAMNLRVAADRLDWLVNPVRDEEDSFSLVKVYCFLVGLSFENLLKGLIMLQRMEDKKRPSLPKECYTHKLEELAEMIDINGLEITNREVELLATLTPYIEWAGRYPFPKKREDIICIMHSSQQHRYELELWEKLARVIKKRGWIMKGGPENKGGLRLYFKKKNQD